MSILKKITVLLLRMGLFFFTIVVLISAFLYIKCSIYKFPPPHPFSGNHLYNPYSNDTAPSWSKANFHAHSMAWKGLTNGKQTPQEVLDTYAMLRYNIASVSNYQRVTTVGNPQIMTIPVYEHGYNIFKTHTLVFEPSKVSFFDAPFFQTSSMKQSVLNALNRESSCIALNHPLLKNGYRDADLKKLSGYQLMEVFNHSANSVRKWDIALSAGKPVWCLGNDDMHTTKKEAEVGVCWTMINHVSTTADIIKQLKKGNAYIVQGKRGIAENALKSLIVTGDTMRLKLSNRANTIRLIGQNGILRQQQEYTDTAAYIFSADDTYIRAEISNSHSLLYLNPVVRYNGEDTPLNSNEATLNIPATLCYKLGVLFLTICLVALLNWRFLIRLYRIHRKRGIPEQRLPYSLERK